MLSVANNAILIEVINVSVTSNYMIFVIDRMLIKEEGYIYVENQI